MSNHTAIQRAYVRRLRHNLLLQFGGQCTNKACASTNQLEFAHKDHSSGDVHGHGRGMSRRYLDIKKHPALYVLLCHHCHLMYDMQMEQLTDRYMDRMTQQELEFTQEQQEKIEWPGDYFKI